MENLNLYHSIIRSIKACSESNKELSNFFINTNSIIQASVFFSGYTLAKVRLESLLNFINSPEGKAKISPEGQEDINLLKSQIENLLSTCNESKITTAKTTLAKAV